MTIRALLRFALYMLAALLGACEGCLVRSPGVCCTSDPQCAELGLPAGSVPDYACGEGYTCRDFGCEPIDAALDAAPDVSFPGRCNPNGRFGQPELLFGDPIAETDFSTTANDLYALAIRNGEVQGTGRNSINDGFPTPTGVGAALQGALRVTGGFLKAYIVAPDARVFVSSRPSKTSPYGPAQPIRIDGVEMHAQELRAAPSGLYWTGGSGLRTASFGASDAVLVNERLVGPGIAAFAISSDERTLFYLDTDLYIATRNSTDQAFDAGTRVDATGELLHAVPLSISFDGCELYVRVVQLGIPRIKVARRSK